MMSGYNSYDFLNNERSLLLSIFSFFRTKRTNPIIYSVFSTMRITKEAGAMKTLTRYRTMPMMKYKIMVFQS